MAAAFVQHGSLFFVMQLRYVANVQQLVFPMSITSAKKAYITFWLSICWDRAWKTSSIIVIAGSPSKQWSWLRNKWYFTLSLVPSERATHAISAFPRPDDTRKEPHLPRHQTGQLPHWPTGLEIRKCHPCSRLRHGETVSRSKNKATHTLSGAKITFGDGALHEHQYTPGPRAVTAR